MWQLKHDNAQGHYVVMISTFTIYPEWKECTYNVWLFTNIDLVSHNASWKKLAFLLY